MSSRSDKKKQAAGAARKRGPVSRRRKSSAPPPTQSFAPPPAPSRATIKLDTEKHPPRCYKYYLVAFGAACLLAYLDDQSRVLVWGLATFFAGLSALVKPPRVGLGGWGDLAVVGFLAVPLLSFLPNFYWPLPDWRVIATDSMGIDLPSVLSVQPWWSFEAYVCLLAGTVWFYAAMQWTVNYGGQRRLYFGLSLLLSVCAGWIIVQDLSGSYELGLDGKVSANLFQAGIGLSGVFALGGIATFAYAVEGLRHRVAMPLFGLPATLLCLAALYLADASAGLVVYCLGVGAWLIWSLLLGSLPRLLCWGLPIVFLVAGVLLWMGGRSPGDFVERIRMDSWAFSETSSPLVQPTIDMILDAPLAGQGLGSFEAVFPQYRGATVGHLPIEHPGSDLLSLAAESGLLSVGFLVLSLYFYLRRCRGFSAGRSVGYRRAAVVVAVAFFGLGVSCGTAQHPGILYFGLLFAAMVLPKDSRQACRLPQFVWRITGGLLVLIGLTWMLAGWLGWPFHSTMLYAHLQSRATNLTLENSQAADLEFLDKWVDLRPLDWQAYSARGERRLLLSGENAAEAAADFDRARFVEPVLGRVTFEEGLAWIGYDAARVIAAWEATLNRALEDRAATFSRMLAMADESSSVRSGLSRLSEISSDFRMLFLARLKGAELMRELQVELERSPALTQFGSEERSMLLENWIEHGDFTTARDFVEANGDSLPRVWWLRSLIHKNQADFRLAVDSIRRHVASPGISESALEPGALDRVSRQFMIQPSDRSKGFALLATYLEGADYGSALSVIDRMLAVDDTDSSLHYWKAEILYQMNDYIESWFAFEQYLIHLWNRPGPAAE